MRLEVFNLNNLTFYLSKEYLNKIKFNLEEDASKAFKSLFIKLKRIFNLDMSGYYEVMVHINNNYGIIIEMEKDDDEYIKIFGDTLDMKITFKYDSDILYKIDNIDFITFKDYKLFYYDNQLYLSLKKNADINEKEYLYLIENSKIIYGYELNCLKKKLQNII